MEKLPKRVYFYKLRPSESILSLPDGEKMYQQCLNFHLSCEMTPEEVHELGLTEVERIYQRISELAIREGYSHYYDYVQAWRVVLDAGFLRVCPIQPHFLRRICLAAGSCPAHSHSSSFQIFSGHRMLKMRLRQKDLLNHVDDLCYNKIQPKLPALFGNMPDSDLRVIPAPPILANAPTGFYYAGTPDGSRPGLYHINIHNLEAM
nr:hypothetical protein BaRGS_001386 [Batillaria attramentaria]